jgi:hypothetical protein
MNSFEEVEQSKFFENFFLNLTVIFFDTKQPGPMLKNMIIVTENRKRRHTLEPCSRDINYAPKVVYYAPKVINYAPRFVYYAPRVINYAPREHL